MGRGTWVLLLVVFPLVFSLAPLLTARGAVMGARTFEASYLLTLPGFAGILFLGFYYARPVGWRLARLAVPSREPRPPSRFWTCIGFVVLLTLLVLIYFVMIRLGFAWFVDPLRPALPNVGAGGGG